MKRTDKLNEGQVQIVDIHNYRPLDNPMVGTTAKKVHRLIQSLLQEGHIDDMTAKWLSLTPDPPRIPVFYTLTKIHKPTPVGRPMVSGCDGPTEKISAFVDHLNSTKTSLVSQRYNRLSLTSSRRLNCLKVQFLSQWASPAKATAIFVPMAVP